MHDELDSANGQVGVVFNGRLQPVSESDVGGTRTEAVVSNPSDDPAANDDRACVVAQRPAGRPDLHEPISYRDRVCQ
jgi:hypothetical protein